MKKQDFLSQTRNLPVKDIYAKITENKKKLTKLQQDKILGKLKNYREITELRRNNARMITVLDEKLTESLKQK